MKKTGKLIVLLSAIVCLAAIFFTSYIQSSSAASISNAAISSISTQAYTGKAVTPAVTVKYGSRSLTKGTHYTVSYINNINIGTATLTITGKGGYSGRKSVTFYIASPAVKGLAYKNVTQTSVNIYWKASVKATGYQIYKYNTSTKTYTFLRASSAPSVTVKGLDAVTLNIFRVRPYNKLANGKLVYGAFSTLKALTCPANVTGAAQSAAKTNAATVAWEKSAGAAGYQVYLYDTASRKYVFKAAVKTNYYTFTGLNASLSTYVRIRAYRSVNGKALLSGFTTVQLKTLQKDSVTSLTAYRVYDNYVTLKWNSVPGASLYRVYLLKNGKWTASKLTSATAANITGLTDCTNYSFRVVTCVKSGNRYFNGAVKSTLNLTTAPQKINNITSSVTNSSVTLKWDEVNTKSGYQVYCLNSLTNKYVLYKNTDEASCTVSELSAATEYSFKIRAYYRNPETKKLSFGSLSEVQSIKTANNVTSVITDKDSISLAVNEKAMLSCKALPETAYNTGFIFSTDKSAVATVTPDGIITARGAGTATITVTAKDNKDAKATCKITVKSDIVAVNDIKLSLDAVSLYVDETAVLIATILPSDATNKAVTWISSNEEVASVNENGTVTAKAQGKATVTAFAANGMKKAVCEVTVNIRTISVKRVTLTPASAIINVGETQALKAEIEPENATNKSVTWKSSNTAVASVDKNGVVKALSNGTATITVTTVDSGKVDTCNVRVITPVVYVTDVKLTPATATVNVGQTLTLTASVEPSNATDKSVSWRSSNSAVATVNVGGVVKGISDGTAVITVTTQDGKKVASCSITVIKSTISVTSVTLSKTSATLDTGKTMGLSATVLPADASNKAVIWSSSDPEVATVNNGSVKGIKAGTAIITVKTVDGNKTASCTLKVVVPTIAVSGVTLDKTAATLNIGQNLTLSATVSPASATDKSVVWSSSNPTVAAVTNGIVTAKASGTATITVKTTDNSKSAACVITVPEPFVPVTGITLNRTSASVSVGRTVILVATVSPENATNKTVTWRSSDSSVVSVGSNGVAKAEKIGTATVTATTLDGNKTASCEITVAPVSVTGVKLDASAISLYVGESKTLTATVSPSNATNPSVTWKSSNTAVASVNRYGKLTANADGKAEITVTTEDGSKTATCVVTVTTRVYSVTGVVLNKSTETLDIDGTAYLSATVLPLNATNKAVTWSSSNTSVAKVFTNGTVVAVGVGTAVITVKTADGAKTATCTVTVKKPLNYTLPNVSTAALLLPEFSGRFNKIKQIDRPAFTSVKKVKFSDIKLEGAVGGSITESIFQSLFDSLNEDETVTMKAVPKGITDYDDATLNKYIRAIPVIGYSSSVRSGLNANAIDMTKSGLKNDSENTYELSIALNSETLNALPTNSTDTSNHGRIFDILYQKYIDDCKKELSDAKLDYSAFKTTYHDSSVTITIDKATDRVIKAVYDMNVKVEITNLKIYTSTISTASFDVNSHTDITFTY